MTCSRGRGNDISDAGWDRNGSDPKMEVACEDRALSKGEHRRGGCSQLSWSRESGSSVLGGGEAGRAFQRLMDTVQLFGRGTSLENSGHPVILTQLFILPLEAHLEVLVKCHNCSWKSPGDCVAG